jgi:4-coumarate--CoA ligase
MPEHSVSKAGSIGLLHPNLEARLVNEDNNGEEVDVAEGEPGELWIRGASVMKVRLVEGGNIWH